MAVPQKVPQFVHRPPRRLEKALAAGTAFTNAQILYEIIPVFGSFRTRIRAKTATAGATLNVYFVDPNFDVTQADGASPVAYGSLVGTIYTTGGGTATLTAGTESKIDIDLYGEGFMLIELVGSGSGTITFIDVSQLPTA